MNLPVMLDIAIGLIFIYLILSLLASEIQELLSTLLQWRAEHLKKSIEILLAGGCNTPEEERVIELANSLYNNPLIKNINQEAKGLLVSLPRQLTWLISSIYRYCMKMIPVNTRDQSVFGKITNNTDKTDNTNNEKQRHTGPSYIDSETFATTLLETLKFPTVSHRITISKLKEFKDERLVKEMQAILNTLNANLSADESRNNETESVYPKIDRKFANLKKQFDKIVNDFENNKGSLITSLDRIQEKYDLFITDIKDDFSSENLSIGKIFYRNLTSFKKDLFGSDPKSNQAEKLVLLGGLKPSLNEIVQTYKEARKQIKEAKDTNSPVDQKIQEIFQDIQEEIDKLPNSVLDSLEVLAIRAQAKVKSTEEDINQLRQEIEVWFDRSMERAGGVYKRNAKGVAIMIGCLIAIAANADTLYIVDRLSKDSVIREAISESASNIASTSDISNVRSKVDDALQDLSLPIGWNLQYSQQTTDQSKSKAQKLPSNQTLPQIIFQTLQKLFGWLLSGIAIAMGAPFWFDLLNRVVNVRNAGKRPHSSANSATTSDN